MALNFPIPTSVGQVYQDPTSGNTYVCTSLGPPAQWVGSGSSTSLDSTYLRTDASNDPVTGNLLLNPTTNVSPLTLQQPVGNTTPALKIENSGSGNSIEANGFSVSQTGITALPSGTVASPSITTSGDTNTGIYFPAADTIGLVEGGTEVVRINSSGNVGIGTSDPLNTLHISRGSGAPGRVNSIRLGCPPSGSTSPVETAIVYGGDIWGETDQTGRIRFIRTNPSFHNWVEIAFDVSNASGPNASAIERMRLNKDGYLLVGYTSSNGAYCLQVNSQIFATSSTIATSDARYKQNIIPLDHSLELVEKLNPVQFEWKDHPIHNFEKVPTVGFLAQEVLESLDGKPWLPSLIKSNTVTIPATETEPEKTEEFLGIAEGNLIPILTKAIQELSDKVKGLELQVASLLTS